MENFYKNVLHLMAGIGLNLGHFQQKYMKIGIKFLMYFNSIAITLTILQEAIFLGDERNPIVPRLCVIPCMLSVGEAFVKYFNGLHHAEKIKTVMDNLDKIYNQMENDEKTRFKMRSFRLRKIAVWFGCANMIVVWIFNLFPILTMLKVFITDGIWVQIYPFPFWWPFNNADYFISTYLYQVYVSQIGTIQMLIVDVLYMMIFAQVASHYKHLSESFSDLIEKIKDMKTIDKKSEEKLKNLVEPQVELNNNCNMINEIFGFAILLRVFVACLNICLTGFLFVTQNDPAILVPFCSLLIISIIHTFFLCWFGNEIEEEVSVTA
jgi:hypothetical protein